MNRSNLKGNWPVMIGALASFVYFGVGHFVALPEFVRGLLLGVSIAGYALGLLVLKFGFNRLRQWKRGLLHRQR